MAESRNCPFCNTLLPSDVGGLRATCPRCGESLASLKLNGEPNSSQSLADSTPLAPFGTPQSKRRWPLYLVTAALVALGVWIATGVRWKADVSRSPGQTNESIHRVRQPVDLPGLGYLPESTDCILTIQLPALLEKFGPEYRTNPARALAELGVPDNVIETIDHASGVGLKNVDELVIGMGFAKGSFPPQVFVIAHTREPYDIAALARQADARALKSGGRTLYAAKASPVPNVYWWGPNNRVLVTTLLPRDFADVPLQPRSGVNHLKPEVVKLIRDRIATDASAWLVASSDRWADHLQPYTFLPFTPLQGRTDLLAPAARLRSFTLSIPQSADSDVDMQIELKSATAAEDLRTVLADRFRGEPVVVGGEVEVCRLQEPFDANQLGSLIARLVGPSR